MRRIRQWAGWLLIMVGWAILGCTYAGSLSATLDAFASFLPFAPIAIVAALILHPMRARSAVFVPAGIGLALGIVPIATEIMATSPRAQPGAVRVVVVTHNLGDATPILTARVLIESGADILLLQEARHAGATLRSLAPYYPYRDACGSCELAILSRRPMSWVHWRFPARGGGLVGPPLYRADVELPGAGTLQVATVHAPWPLPAARQAAFRAALIDAVQQQATERLVLAGDFNLTPWGHGMRELDSGLFPMTRITRAMFSFPARIGGNAWPLLLLPIDQMFIGRDIAVGAVDLLRPTGSDHRAIRAELYVTPSPSGHSSTPANTKD